MSIFVELQDSTFRKISEDGDSSSDCNDYPVVNGGSDKRSVWGTHIPYSYLIYGEPRSYLEFPNHLIVLDYRWSCSIAVPEGNDWSCY